MSLLKLNMLDLKEEFSLRPPSCIRWYHFSNAAQQRIRTHDGAMFVSAGGNTYWIHSPEHVESEYGTNVLGEE